MGINLCMGNLLVAMATLIGKDSSNFNLLFELGVTEDSLWHD